jgi:hypothetical protein
MATRLDDGPRAPTYVPDDMERYKVAYRNCLDNCVYGTDCMVDPFACPYYHNWPKPEDYQTPGSVLVPAAEGNGFWYGIAWGLAATCTLIGLWTVLVWAWGTAVWLWFVASRALGVLPW